MVSVSRTAAPLVKHCCIPEINSYSQISSLSPLHRNVPLLKLQHFPDEWETSSINSCLALLLNRKWYKKMFVQYQIILHSHIIAPYYWQAQKKKGNFKYFWLGWWAKLSMVPQHFRPVTSFPGLRAYQSFGVKDFGLIPMHISTYQCKVLKNTKITIYMWSRIGSTAAPSLVSSGSQKVTHSDFSSHYRGEFWPMKVNVLRSPKAFDVSLKTYSTKTTWDYRSFQVYTGLQLQIYRWQHW